MWQIVYATNPRPAFVYSVLIYAASLEEAKEYLRFQEEEEDIIILHTYALSPEEVRP